MAAVVGVIGVVAPRPAAGDVTTVSHDAARTGWDPNEPGLGPDSVTSSDFGLRFSTSVDGQVYAQPLVVGGTLIVATENNMVYGLDATTGSVKWRRAMGPAWPAAGIACADLTPTIGTTSTPVYDPATNAVYLTSKVNDGPDVRHPHWYMHAIDPGSGAERPGWPVTIAGKPSNDPTTAFDPMTEGQRAGLLLLDGVVYASFASHCDHGLWRGYVAGVSTTSARLSSLWAAEVNGNKGAGVWQSGGGLVSDGTGRAFLSTGNGISPPARPGGRPPGTLGESVVRLNAVAGRALTAVDFFSPANAPMLDRRDSDLGSGGPIALPDFFGTPTHRHVLVQQGKDGRVFLLDRDHLGGRSQGKGGTDAVLGVVGPYQGQWGHPAAWTGAGGYVYLIDNGGPLRALKHGATGSGLPALSLAGTSAATFPYTSGSPVITSDDTKAGTGVVWSIWSSGPKGGNATLRAYAAEPDSAGRLALLYSAPIGTASKFAVPATDRNHVYVGTRDGTVLGFSRATTSALTGSPIDFGNVAVGARTGKTLTVTATKAVNVTALSVNAPFAVTPPSLPVAMQPGDRLALPVSFSPSAPGAASEILSVVTDSGTFGFSLNGVGTQPGLNASPAAATFTDQPVGTTATVNVQVTNTGTSNETITSVTGASGPFKASGLPGTGTTLPPGGSFVVSVSYTPTKASASDVSSITLTSTSGRLTIPITGNAVGGAGKLVLTPPVLDFGWLAAGTSRTLTFDIINTGNVPVTLTKAKAPASDFTSSDPVPEGTVIGSGQVIHQSVTFTPGKPGLQNDTYTITGDAGQGVMSERLTGVGTGTLPTPDASTWSVNPAAAVSNAAITLTPAAKNKAGSAFYRRAVRTEGLQATFFARMRGGTGGDGLSFALLDPARSTPASVGGAGNGVGFRGLHGVAVILLTTRNAQAGSSNFVGVAIGPGDRNGLRYTATRTVPTPLRAGTHRVDVQVIKGHIKVSVDRKALLDAVPPAGSIPPNALAGFTGGTGALTDVHVVDQVTITTNTRYPRGPAPGVPGAGAPLTPNPVSVDFGTVQVGATDSATLILTNNGSRPETVSAVAAPGAPYTAGLPAVGSTVAPHASVDVPVTFTPTTEGTFVQSLMVTTTSGSVVVPLTGSGRGTLPALTSSSWTYSGLATLSGDTATLTMDGQKNGAGSLVNSIPVSPLGLHATFTAQIGGSHATGADGLTFALLDAATANPTSLGGTGAGLGISGLPAVFAALDTYNNTGITSRNFAGVGTAQPGSTTLTFLKTTTAIPALRSGTHLIDVTVTRARHLIVKIDGSQVLDAAVTLPPKVLVAFTAAVGKLTDTHAVINPTVHYTE